MKTSTASLVILILLGISNLHGQMLTLGIKGGISIPNLTGGGTENPLNAGYSSRLGANSGIYGEYHLSDLFSISLGVEYSSQGGKKNKFQALTVPAEMASLLPPNTPYLYANYKSDAILDYLLIPVLGRCSWKLSPSGPLKVYAAVGPFAGFLLKAHQVTSGSSILYMDAEGTMPISDQPQSFDSDTNIKDQLRTFNTGVMGFIGMAYQLSPQHAIFIEGGGNYGFISIQKGASNGNNYTGAGVVSLGYAYHF
jgi:hypothetical protein